MIFIIFAFSIAGCAAFSKKQSDVFCVMLGQEWRYETRDHEEESRVIIVEAFINKNKERFYIIRVTGVKIDDPNFLNYFPDRNAYFIITEKGLSDSLVSLVGESSWNMYYDENYIRWKRNLRNPDYFGDTIKNKLNTLEEILSTNVGA